MFEDTMDYQNEAETCVVCGKAVSGGAGFCRMNHDGFMVNLCCPLCADVFQKDPKPFMQRFHKIREYRELHKLTHPS